MIGWWFARLLPPANRCLRRSKTKTANGGVSSCLTPLLPVSLYLFLVLLLVATSCRRALLTAATSFLFPATSFILYTAHLTAQSRPPPPPPACRSPFFPPPPRPLLSSSTRPPTNFFSPLIPIMHFNTGCLCPALTRQEAPPTHPPVPSPFHIYYLWLLFFSFIVLMYF